MVVAPHREGGQAQYVEAPVAARAGRGIAPAMDWARASLDQPLSVAELAARSAMSERTFLRRFGEATGMAPLAWLQQQRIAHARQLMEAHPAMPTGDIATQSGYESIETFRAAFRRVAGVAPSRYRARFASAAG
jgi:AraC family transcriptional activator FtrA